MKLLIVLHFLTFPYPDLVVDDAPTSVRGLNPPGMDPPGLFPPGVTIVRGLHSPFLEAIASHEPGLSLTQSVRHN